MLDLRSDPEFLSRRLREEAERLAGGKRAFAQRAAIYHHLYASSFGNHTFPLVAAHGSLWVERYLKGLARSANLRRWEHLSPARRKVRMEAIRGLAELIDEIDSRMCVETYYLYRLTEHREGREFAEAFFCSTLLDQMEGCHAARRARRKFTAAERRSLFVNTLRWQQEGVIESIIEAASADFDSQPIRVLAMQAPIRFGYFPPRQGLRLTGSESSDERVALGVRAFDLAEQAGWDKVESSLRSCRTMPTRFQRNSGQHFFAIQNDVRRILRREFLAAC